MTETIQITEICPTTTQSYVRQGATVVDVREPGEVAQLAFDVPKIIHLPLSEFEERYHELPKDENLVMVCKVGGRSLKAAAWLLHHGWAPARVVNMKHGIVRWAERGFPLKGDPSSVLSGNGGGGCCGGGTDANTEQKVESCCDGNPSSNGNTCC